MFIVSFLIFLDHPEISKRSGKLNQIDRFDAAFFGVHYNQAHSMDPMSRIILEKSYEAIVDSGNTPGHLLFSQKLVEFFIQVPIFSVATKNGGLTFLKMFFKNKIFKNLRFTVH